jgi:hypothetical protein
MAWMDANMFGTCTANIATVSKQTLEIFPNPSTTSLTITGLKGAGVLQVLDLSGKMVASYPYHSSSIELMIEDFQNGIYFISETNKGIHEKFLKL